MWLMLSPFLSGGKIPGENPGEKPSLGVRKNTTAAALIHKVITYGGGFPRGQKILFAKHNFENGLQLEHSFLS